VDTTPLRTTRQPFRRRIRWRLAVLIVAAIVVLARGSAFVAAVSRIGQLRPGWLVAAFVAEVVSFVLAAELQHELLSSAHVHVGRWFLLAVTYAGAALSRTLPAGTAFSIGYTYRRLLRRGVDVGLARWTLAASGIVSVATLAVIGVVGAQLGGVGVLSSAAGTTAGVAVIAAVLGTIALLAWGSRHASGFERLGHALSRRVDDRLRVLGLGLRSTPRSTKTDPIDVGPWDWLRACGLSAGNWFADVLAIGMTFLAVGLPVPWSRLLWAYVVIQVVVSLPILGCIGLAEGSMTVALATIGVPPASALAVVLIYRLLSFWLTVPVGWFASRYLARAESTESTHGRLYPWTPTVSAPVRAAAVNARC
jgi:uncharacterized membrane protein YbhN (UPF0104 family)